MRPLLYYITDRMQFAGDETTRRRKLLEKISEAARAGVDYIQLREKDLSARDLEEVAREATRLVREQTTATPLRNCLHSRILINSRIDVALAVGCDGVHLRSDDPSPHEARVIAKAVSTRDSKLETRNFVIGVSCHSEEDVRAAAQDGADFVVFAPVFEKKDNAPARVAGLDLLARACRHGVPVFALGGVTLDNARSCLEMGAAGIAGIRLFQQSAIADVVPLRD
jgi:thiamine-phosphate pyrophosphorylase